MFPCLEGYYCPEATHYANEFPCPTGKYNPLRNQTLDSACIICQPGYYCPQGTGSLSYACPAGYYCPIGTGSAKSYACPIGTYSSVLSLQNASQCISCPVGHYCPDGSKLEPTVSPIPCPPGTYNMNMSAGHILNCKPCDAGRTCPVPGLSSPNGSCDIGHYCPPGTIVGNQFPCPPGTYTNETNLKWAEECIPCPASFSCTWATGFPVKPWQFCRQGHYCPQGIFCLTLFFSRLFILFKLQNLKTEVPKIVYFY